MMVAEQENLLNQVRFEVVRARQQYLTARERTEVAERMIRQATEAVRIVQDRYREGLTTMTEVLRAQTTLSRARMMELAARYDCYIGYAQLLLTTGRLTDVQPFVS
jgi:outer membrane protein TolC